MKPCHLASSLLAFVMVTQMSLAAEPSAAIAPDNTNLHIRAGLPNLKQRLAIDKECHVAFLGAKNMPQKTCQAV
jgi:hypothetical protein